MGTRGVGSEGGPVRVYPPLIEFPDVDRGTLYVMRVSIQNISKEASRIRLQPPQSSFFSVNYFPTQAIAPGLEVHAEIELFIPDNAGSRVKTAEGETNQQRDFEDTLTVICGKHKYPVQLRAFTPGPRIEVEANGLVSMGTVVQGNTATRFVQVRNIGSRPGKFKLTGDLGANVTVFPSSGTLQPITGDNVKLSERLKIDFHGTNSGPFRARLNLEVEGLPPKIIDISANVVEQRLEVVHTNKGGTVDSAITFGSVYFGQKRSIQVLLVNNGPQPAQYSILFKPGSGYHLYKDSPRPDDPEQDELPSHDDDDNEDPLHGFSNSLLESSPLSVTPCEGVLNPYEQAPLTLTFAPKNPKQRKGFKAKGDLSLFDSVDLDMDVMISCPDTNQNVKLALSGRAIKPKLHVNRKTFKFGTCPTNDRRDISFVLTNRSDDLPVEFSFNKIAFFSCKPATGHLLPGQSQTILMTFSPGQIGSFRNSMHLVLNGGIAVIPLVVSGSSNSIGQRKKIPGGPNAIMADFEPKVKYVDDEEVRRQEKIKPTFKRIPPWEKKRLALKEADGGSSSPTHNRLMQQPLSPNNGVQEGTYAVSEMHDNYEGDSEENSDDEAFGGFKSYDPTYTYPTSDLIRKQNHRDQYADFLKRAHKARMEKREAIAEKKHLKKHKIAKSTATKSMKKRLKGEGSDSEEDDHDPFANEDNGNGSDVDLDLDPHGGLCSPRLQVPKEVDPLWLERPLDPSMGAQGTLNGPRSRNHTKTHDEDKLLKRKYKPKPTTQAEMVDCAAKLSSADLVRITPAPKTIDFGVVSVNSKNAKCLGITNELSQSILIEILFDEHDELASSFPASQVIPPGTKAGFDVIFISSTQPPPNQSNRFKQSLTYVVNGQHKFKVTVAAEVIPIKVELNPPILNMAFADDNIGQETSETVTLTNTGNAPARYQWVHSRDSSQTTMKGSPVHHSAFSVEPASDVIEPCQSKQVIVTFRPSSKAPKEENLLLRVRGGYDEVLACVGKIEEPNCVFVERRLDFGQIPVGIPHEKTIELKNTGTHAAVYFIRDLPDGITASPEKGKIPPHSTVPIKILFEPTKPVRLDSSTHFVTAQLRGGRDLRLPILCEAVLPDVELVTDCTDFEGVTIGSNATQPIVVQNKSSVPAILTLDLSKYIEFDVSVLEDKLRAEGYEDDDLESCFRPITADKATRGFNPSSPTSPDDEDLQPVDAECSMFKVKVPPMKSLELSLTYSPTQVTVHDFPLPLRLTGRGTLLRHVVRCQGLKPKLTVSDSTMNFETRIVARDRIKKIPFYKEVTVTNHHSEVLKWEFGKPAFLSPVMTADEQDQSHLLGAVFTIKPSRGQLEPGDSCVVKIGFLPSSEEHYSAILPIYIDEQTDREYIHVKVLGVGAFPKLKFDTQEVVLPTVPLGVKAVGTFTVINDGFENLELQTKLPPESQRIPLTINFPEGRNIGVGRPEVPVEITFASKKPMSFTAKIEFVDQEGNRFSIFVTGTTDNCLLTSFPFVAAVRDVFDFVSTDLSRPVQFIPRDQPLEMGGGNTAPRANSMKPGLLSRGTTMLSSMGDSGELFTGKGNLLRGRKPGDPFVADNSLVETASTSKESLSQLVRFLNITSFQIPLIDFPGDLINANGKQVFDLVESLTGKALAGRMRGVTNNMSKKKRKEMVPQLIAQYASLLKFLKTRGGLLHEIRPEQFLSKDDYVRFKEREFQTGDGCDTAGVGNSGLTVVLAGSASASTISMAHGQALQRRHQFEREHESLSLAAWSNVLLQIVKLFMLNRVTPKQYRSLPGIDGAGVNNLKHLSNSASSNIYSSSESILLHWLNVHFAKGSNLVLGVGGGGVPAADMLPEGETNPYKQNDPIVNFDLDLSNGVVLCMLVASHVPMLIEPGRALNSVILEPVDENQCLSNLRAFCAALKELNLDYRRTPDDMMPSVANARDNLLFVLYLYQTLPQFIPKATVEFSCALGSKVTKGIELRNPSASLLGYHVTLDGSRDFVVPTNYVLLEPHGAAHLSVELTSRFSRSVEATLMLKPDRNTGGCSDEGSASTSTPGALVFKLVSAVHSRRSIRTIKCATRTYESLPLDIEVTNPFNIEGKFAMALVQERMSSPVEGSGSKANNMKANSRKNLGPDRKKKAPANKRRPGMEAPDIKVQNPLSEKLPDAFSTKVTVVKLKPLESTVVRMQFLPFMPGEYRCQVIFMDEAVGEFLYEIVGDAARPAPVEKISFTTEAKQNVTKAISVPLANKQLEKALVHLPHDAPEFSGLSSIDPVRCICFQVETDSPYYVVPSKILISDPLPANHLESASEASADGRKSNLSNKTSKTASSSGGAGKYEFSVDFQPGNAGIYPCQLVLASESQVRVIELECVVSTPPVTSELEFSAPARQKIAQRIPIMNTSEEIWTIQAILEGENCFSGKRSMTVQPDGASAEYTLEFLAPWVGEYKGKLTLHNTTTDERMIYNLTGVAKEPLAEDHVVIECQAREKLIHKFKVPHQFGKSAGNRFTVESDMQHVSGRSMITVEPGEVGEYELTVHPLLGGIYSGSITFSLGPGKPFLWYTLEVQASSSKPEEKLEISTFVRKAVAVEITLSNVLDVPVEFEVSLQGHGLIGDPVFLLEAQETGSYELIFSPLLSGTQMGSVSFTNERVGEVWYELDLKALPAEPIKLPAVQCAVGNKATTQVVLENPLGNPVDIKSVISNRQNFAVRPGNPTIPPYSQATVLIDYIPSTVNMEEAGVIKFSSPLLGEWEYHITGMGEDPGVMPRVDVTACVGVTESSSFPFVNPFAQPLKVVIKMSSQSPESFKLLLSKDRHLVPAFSTLMIPFSFAPKEMTEKHASVTVQSEDSALCWTFPIRGISEAPIHYEVFQIRTRARESTETIIQLPLSGLGDITTSEPFSHEIVVPEDSKLMVQRSVSVVPLETRLKHGDQKLPFQVKFEPLRPFSTTVDLYLTRRSGGRWRFQLSFVAEEPLIDDIIDIQAAPSQTSSVSFSLTNLFPSPATFEAFLTVESSFEFAVYPSTGVLKSSDDSEGTNFIVSFSPTEYGKAVSGKLIIRTQEMQWSYELRGTHPDYTAPRGTAKVSSRPSKHVLKALADAQGKRKRPLGKK